MVGVLRKPLEAGTVGLAGLERSLPPCGLCQALFFTADSCLHMERVTIVPKLPCKASGAAGQSCCPESQRCQGAAGPHGGHVPPDRVQGPGRPHSQCWPRDPVWPGQWLTYVILKRFRHV